MCEKNCCSIWFVYNITFLSLLFSFSVLNAFKFPLLIGIGLSSVIGLLSCLIGYCSSRWCCKKEVQETRRERRRLMSMEMDWRREMDNLILGQRDFGRAKFTQTWVWWTKIPWQQNHLILFWIWSCFFLPMFHTENTWCVCQHLALFPMALFIGIAISKENSCTDF